MLVGHKIKKNQYFKIFIILLKKPKNQNNVDYKELKQTLFWIVTYTIRVPK